MYFHVNMFISIVKVTFSYTKKTEGLELGAVDKLLVGIFAGRDGEGKISPTLPVHHYSFLFIIQ